MIISPPFLLPRNANETDEAWINRCMTGGEAGNGAFPLSHAFQWHGGMHLQEPTANASVRAIADGEVVYRRAPKRQPSGPLPPDHPQAYRGGWTDNGVVVLRHRTEIGEGANASVTFYSIYMHLGEVHSSITPNGTVYRKAVLGRAGQIYGDAQRQIHFEIVCDDANLVRLAGRGSGNLPIGSNGRTDALYGEVYFRLTAGTQVFPVRPALNAAAGTGGVALGADVFVGLRYAGGDGAADHRGDAYLSTYELDGTLIGTALEEHEAEYKLYDSAVAISEAYAASARPTPSAVFELLRFGRVLGPEALNPANVPHWREISYAGGRGWVNLNAFGVTKFSDADLPHWKNWSLVDDSADQDSRCDSSVVKGWFDINGNGSVTPAEAAARIAHITVAPKLARSICKFANEWNASDFDRRLGWLKNASVENQTPLDASSFERLRMHVTALGFWGEVNGLPASPWHWQPREFVKHFRKCGWLSVREMTQCIPRNSPAGVVSLNTATARINTWGTGINKMARKYLLQSPIRLTHLLAQVWAETGYLRLTRESGADNARYAPYLGRGLIQITWQDKYDNYRNFCGLPINFNIELIATDHHHAGNSSGFYWVSKSIVEPLRQSNINLSRLADVGLGTEAIGKLCLWINGGGNHYDHRHIHTIFINRVLGDVVCDGLPVSERLSFNKMDFYKESVNRGGRVVRVIRGTQQSQSRMNIEIDHTPQR